MYAIRQYTVRYRYIALEERIQDYRNEWHNRILQDWRSNLRITSQTDEETLNDREDDGRIVFGTKQANKTVP
jgi:hypothetical protein